jgi:hypothetical protein
VTADPTDTIRMLDRMPLNVLRAEWERRYGAAPKLRSPDLLRLLLAWRIQTEVYGGLDAATRRALRASGTPRGALDLRPGSRLVKEWRGRRYEVEVLPEGFSYDGETYRSLSEAARAITGVRWNGPRFFGLRDAAA